MPTQKVTTQAREVMDRVTAAAFGEHKSLSALADCYADDAALSTPDQGEVTGKEQIIEYWRHFVEAFPDGRYEASRRYEADDTAIDEGFFVGTNTAPMPMPSGHALPPTGNTVRLRGCDIATVKNGVIVEHHVYFDQLGLLAQLGVLPEAPV